MISILIPVFNEDVNNLVNDLLLQCEEEKVIFEIIVIDDRSDEETRKVNQSLENKTNVIYKELAENVGRSKIRNLLASKSNYDNLIFLDCDSCLTQNRNFIKNYLTAFSENEIIYGGTDYQDLKPEFKYLLHWKYGKHVESKPAKSRNSVPFTSFRTNNFAIRKSIFEKVNFDESISGYGFEDNKFAFDLEALGYKIIHIDNQVLHLGLNENEDFLNKTKQGLSNLYKLYKKNRITDTKLIELYSKMDRLGLITIVLPIAKKSEYLLRKRILKSPESLTLFQLWKLMTFVLEMKKPA